MSDSLVTVVGRLTADPTWGHTKTGDVFANFDVAVNHGYYDRDRQTYIETGASYFSVSTFRNLAINVVESLHKATPVVIQGKLRLNKWENGEKQGTTARIEAMAVGPNLTFGNAEFTAVKRPRVESNDPMDDANVIDGTAPGEAELEAQADGLGPSGQPEDADLTPDHFEEEVEEELPALSA